MFPSFKDFYSGKEKIAVIGLGYVGLPLAIMFSERFSVIGFDTDERRIEELKIGFDRSGEVDRDRILASNVKFTNNCKELEEARLFIISVPTPIDDHKNPNLTYLEEASKTVAKIIKKVQLWFMNPPSIQVLQRRYVSP